MPAPASCVSMAWRLGESSSPIAAAIPPCAQSVAEPLPRRVLHRTVTRIGASFSAAIKPAIPAPTTMTSLRCSGTRLISGLAAVLEHALDGLARAFGNVRRNRHFVFYCLERMQHFRQRVALHVRT